MKKFSLSKVIILIMVAVIIILSCGCWYFSEESKKLDDSMFIGTPISSTQINFSKVIDEKNDFRTIQQALIIADSVNMPTVTNNLPDAIIRIDDYKAGICFLFANVWFDDDKVIFGLGDQNLQDKVKYKELSGKFGKTVIECISKYRVK